MAYKSQPTITRPANTTAYTAGDVVGGVITFDGAGPYASHALLTSVDLRIQVAALPVGMTSFRLHLYNATPPSAIADNAAWDLPTGDLAGYLGYVDMGSPADMGGSLFCQVDQVNKHVLLGSSQAALYGYLVTNGAFTPAANSEVYIPTLRAVAL